MFESDLNWLQQIARKPSAVASYLLIRAKSELYCPLIAPLFPFKSPSFWPSLILTALRPREDCACWTLAADGSVPVVPSSLDGELCVYMYMYVDLPTTGYRCDEH